MENHTHPPDAPTRRSTRRYWRDNRRIIMSLLVVWFLVAFVLGVFLVEPLNAFHLAGFPLGFWIAQQGSIYVFILLILLYCVLMEYGDRKFHLEEKKREENQP